MRKIWAKILQSKFVVFLIERSKRIILPGFDRVPLYYVLKFFVQGLQKGAIMTRASALAFNFFLAIFPAVIFFFTLIPYIPIENFQEELLGLMEDLMPQSAYEASLSTLEDIITRERGGLLSVGFVAAMYFATNGVNAMFSAFNNTYHSIEIRKPVMQRLTAIGITFLIAVLVLVSILLIIFGQKFLDILLEYNFLREKFIYYLLIALKWLVTLALIFFMISFLYYAGPSKKVKWRFFSAGSSLATFLMVLTSVGFSYFVNNFAQYNKLYGSIGTLIVILLWIQWNSFALLLGFELNASIDIAKRKNQLELDIPDRD